jgi:SAM-dependent methyltransferase
MFEFVCNICGSPTQAPRDQLTREGESCSICHSTVRYRWLMHQLSVTLFGKSIPLPDFPIDRSIRGLGTSDWEGFAGTLAAKVDYVNRFYDAEPLIDLTDTPAELAGTHDFVICTEVLEHIQAPVQRAFDGIRSLLRTGGVALITVPYQITRRTIEHFENLHEWTFCRLHNDVVLVNRRIDGTYEVFDKLLFHGGRGSTLEMRVFGKQDLEEHLGRAGFEFTFVKDPYPEFGIFWPDPWSLPIIAVKR